MENCGHWCALFRGAHGRLFLSLSRGKLPCLSGSYHILCAGITGANAMSFLKNHNVTQSSDGGRTIVFVHGYGCDQNMWRYVVPLLFGTGKIVLYDLMGMGKSDAANYDFDRYQSLTGHAEDLVGILDELDAVDAVLVGHSVGGTIAALAAQMVPDRIKALALIAPSPCFINDADYVGGFDLETIEGLIDLMEQNFLGWTSQLVPTITGQKADGLASTELAESFCRANPKISKHFGRVTFLADHREDMSKIHCQTLIVQCSDDALAPLNVGNWLASAIPSSELKVVDATGHCPHMTEPAKTADLLAEFLEALK